ncbi:MAG: hypothetical protein P4L33_07495 [Capsulimonadaceae bacterium]|nr:hypothetical protein [Capsulimonadaceae bacterium]
MPHPTNPHAPPHQAHATTVKYIDQGDNAFCQCDWEGAIYNYTKALRGALTHGSSSQHGTYVYVKGQLRLSLEMEYAAARTFDRSPIAKSWTTTPANAESYLTKADQEATICEQQGVQAAWTPVPGARGASTSNIVGMIEASPHLTAMVNAMDAYARAAGVTSELINLRGRWLKIVSAAYHEAPATLALDNGYMQFQAAHPGLSMEGTQVNWLSLTNAANGGQAAGANRGPTEEVRRAVHEEIDAIEKERDSMGTPPDDTRARMAYEDHVKSLNAQERAAYASIGETPPPAVQIFH